MLVVGVAYKPDVEDVRESPALEIIEELLEAGAHVAYHDPLVPELALPGLGRAPRTSADPAAFGADLVVVHTAHTGLDLGWLPGAGRAGHHLPDDRPAAPRRRLEPRTTADNPQENPRVPFLPDDRVVVPERAAPATAPLGGAVLQRCSCCSAC